MREHKAKIKFSQNEIVLDLLKHPIAKTIIYAGSALLFIYAGSFAMRVLASSVTSYKALNKAINS